MKELSIECFVNVATLDLLARLNSFLIDLYKLLGHLIQSLSEN